MKPNGVSLLQATTNAWQSYVIFMQFGTSYGKINVVIVTDRGIYVLWMSKVLKSDLCTKCLHLKQMLPSFFRGQFIDF